MHAVTYLIAQLIYYAYAVALGLVAVETVRSVRRFSRRRDR